MMMNIIRNIARYLISIVFIFSGFVKAVDPLGFKYKLADYFEAWGLEFMMGIALPLGVLVICGEFLIGLALFFKLRMRASAWAVLIFMLFFTLLTFIVALTNPVTDCGCFGDAIILTNWQTFFKNIIFLVPTLVVFQQRNQFQLSFKPVTEWILVACLFLSTILFSVYCIRNLPLVDFRPYHIGANIPEGMQIPEGMPVDEYETILVYEKDGVSQEFTLQSPEAPWSDTSYSWVETRNVLISKGYVPPIHDFTLAGSEGEDITDQVLSDPGYSFLVVVHDVEEAKIGGLQKINALMEQALESGFSVYGMTASLHDAVVAVSGKFNPVFEFYTTDEITLKTMVRSNPGLLLLKDGTVIGKWHHRNIPGPEIFEKSAMAVAISDLESRKNDFIYISFTLVIGFIGLLFVCFKLIKTD